MPSQPHPADAGDHTAAVSVADILFAVACSLEQKAEALEGDPGTLRAVAAAIREQVAAL